MRDHDGTHDNGQRGMKEVCHQSLVSLSAARRTKRDISPELSDAVDMAMESLRTALTILELEGDDQEEQS